MRILKHCLGATLAVALSCSAAAGQGRWVAAYSPGRDPLTAALGASLQQWGMLESVLEPLNRDMELPRDLTVEMAECGTPGATYDPGRPAIRLCYELFNQLVKHSEAGGEGSAELFGRAFRIIFLHQAGHALIDLLKLEPGVPLEEAADQFAVIGTAEPGDAERWLNAAAALYEHQVDWEHPGSGETALDSSRMARLTCLFHGSDPEAFGSSTGKRPPSPAGAANCEDEYAAMVAAWVGMLGPYLRK